jgi:hypothetical protein
MITMRVMGPGLQSSVDVVPAIVAAAGLPGGTDSGRPAVSSLAALAAMGRYAAYGSNMDQAQLLRRSPSSPFLG